MDPDIAEWEAAHKTATTPAIDPDIAEWQAAQQAAAASSVSRSPTWGESAELVGRTFAEGAAGTMDFLSPLIGQYNPISYSEALKLKGWDTSQGPQIKGPGIEVIKGGVRGLATPGGPVANFIAGATGEIGRQIAEYFFPDSAIAQGVGSLAGSIAPSALTGAARSFTGAQTKKAAQTAVGEALDTLGVTADDIGTARFANQTTAELVSDPAKMAKLAALEAEVGAQKADDYSSLLAQRLSDRAKAYTSVLPEDAGAAADDVISYATQQRAPLVEALETTKASVQPEISKAGARAAVQKAGISLKELPKAGNLDELGVKARAIAKPIAEAEEKLAHELYDAVDKRANVPLAKSVAEARAYVDDLFSVRDPIVGTVSRDIPKDILKELNAIELEAGITKDGDINPINLQRAINLRGKLYAKGQAVGGTEGKAFKEMSSLITKAIEDAPNVNKGLDAKNLEAWRTANDNWKEFSTTYRRGAVGQSLAKGPYGMEKLTDEQAAKKLLSTGRGLDDFLKATKGSPQALELAEAAVMRQITDADGILDPKKAASYLSGKRELFERVPKLRDKIKDSLLKFDEIDKVEKEATTALRESVKAAKGKLSEFDETILGRLATSGKASDSAIESILGRKDLKQFLSGLPEDTRSALSKTVYNNLIKGVIRSEDATGQTLLNEATLKRKFLQNPEKLKLVLGDELFEHLQNNVANYISRANVQEASKLASVGGSQTAQRLGKNVDRVLRKKKAPLIKVPDWAKMVLGGPAVYARPEIALPLVGIAVTKQTLNARAANLTREALYDALINPEKAKGALRLATEAATKRSNRLATNIFIGAKNVPQDIFNLSPDDANAESLPNIFSPQKKTSVIEKPMSETPKHSGVDFETLKTAITARESAGNPSAVSPKGATGLMQIMPNTAKEIAKDLGVKEYDLKDPETNQKFGMHYIKKQLQRFGDLDLALAAYNAGPERVQQWIDNWGKDWGVIKEKLEARNAYKETTEYVPWIKERYKELLA